MLYDQPTVRLDMDEMVRACEGDLRALDGKTVLVTGANGMLARYLVYLLMRWNESRGGSIRVLALVRNRRRGGESFGGFAGSAPFRLVVQDACDPIDVGERVDYAVHAASSASPKSIKTDPVGIIKANVEGTGSVLELARRNPGCRVLFTSTREVYGAVSGRDLIGEGDMGALDPLDPRSCYPESKRMGEQLCRAYAVQHGVDFLVARIAHAYGPGISIDGDGRVMADFLADASAGRDIAMNSDGSAVRAFLYITDAVAALLRILVAGRAGEAYNVANEAQPVTVRELAEEVALAAGRGSRVVCRPAADRSAYVAWRRVGLDTSKLEALGWMPNVSLSIGIQRTLNSIEEA